MSFNKFFFSLVVALFVASCSTDEPDSGVPITMDVTVESRALPVLGDALSEADPFHVVAYTYDDTAVGKYVYAWESDAYKGKDGKIHWIGIERNWAWTKMKFVAYYPANSNIELTSYGGIGYSDCSLLAICMKVSFKTENPNLLFMLFSMAIFPNSSESY